MKEVSGTGYLGMRNVFDSICPRQTEKMMKLMSNDFVNDPDWYEWHFNSNVLPILVQKLTTLVEDLTCPKEDLRVLGLRENK